MNRLLNLCDKYTSKNNTNLKKVYEYIKISNITSQLQKIDTNYFDELTQSIFKEKNNSYEIFIMKWEPGQVSLMHDRYKNGCCMILLSNNNNTLYEKSNYFDTYKKISSVNFIQSEKYSLKNVGVENVYTLHIF